MGNPDFSLKRCQTMTEKDLRSMGFRQLGTFADLGIYGAGTQRYLMRQSGDSLQVYMRFEADSPPNVSENVVYLSLMPDRS